MNVNTYQNPLSLLQDLQREVTGACGVRGNLFGNYDLSTGANSHWSPAVDIKEEANQFVLLADLPGVSVKNIDIHMDNGVLTIQGRRESEHKDTDKNCTRIERETGIFMRRFALPSTTDAKNIKAKSKDGVLQVTIGKTKEGTAQHIQVQEG